MRGIECWLRAAPERFPKLVGILSVVGLVQTIFYRAAEGIWVATISLVESAIVVVLTFARVQGNYR